MIRRTPQGFSLYDLGSETGSWVNGKRVVVASEIQGGDRITIGDCDLICDEGFVNQEMRPRGASSATQADSGQVAWIFVSDVLGFTTLGERMPLDDYARIMGNWYGACERVLGGVHGKIVKFAGDAVLAYWEGDAGNGLNALKAVGGMIKACQDIQTKERQIFDSIEMNFGSGFALNRGEVFVMRPGLDLLGDVVNVTFRVEKLTRELGERVLATSSFVESCAEKHAHYFDRLGEHSLKGREQPIEIWSAKNCPSS